jgi:hypothetical protein
MNPWGNTFANVRRLGVGMAVGLAIPILSACNERAYARRAAIDDAYHTRREAIEDRREIRRVPERCSKSRTRRCGFALEPAIAAGGLRAYVCSDGRGCDETKLQELIARMSDWYPESYSKQTIPNADAAGLQAFELRFREQHNVAVNKTLDAELQTAEESRAADLSKDTASTRSSSSSASSADVARVAAASFAGGLIGATRGAAGIQDPAPPSPRSPAPAGIGEPLLLFGGAEHNVFLGCLNCGEYDERSVWNKYSQYGFGNSYGLWSRYGEHLNPYSSTSVCNAYSSDGPLITDSAGSVRGRFTLNAYAVGSVCGAVGDAVTCNVARRLCASR